MNDVPISSGLYYRRRWSTVGERDKESTDMKWRGLVAGIVLGTMGSAFGGGGQPYPERPIHLLIGLPAGGGAGSISRFLATGLRDALGNPVVVEDRNGSYRLIAAEAVAKTTPS